MKAVGSARLHPFTLSIMTEVHGELRLPADMPGARGRPWEGLLSLSSFCVSMIHQNTLDSPAPFPREGENQRA